MLPQMITSSALSLFVAFQLLHTTLTLVTEFWICLKKGTKSWQCVRMEFSLNATTVLQNNPVGLEKSSHKKIIPILFPKINQPQPWWLYSKMAFSWNCSFKNHICNTCGRNRHQETKLRDGKRVPSKNKTTPLLKSTAVYHFEDLWSGSQRAVGHCFKHYINFEGNVGKLG